ncbi:MULTISPECIES: GIVxVP protein [Aphanothece]|uniref:GIVxVP protein n=1 Tax=Aphanothece TaxID=1121 RepID=UPI0039854D1A
MSLNRTARGIVLVPSLLLGGAFLAAAAWLDGPAATNRPLALGLGSLLMGAGLLAQLLPEAEPDRTPAGSARTGADRENSASTGND